ncbi:MAG TPA: hypothetical protein VNH82_09080, partial [Candidatus Dormibacteraeota bacterium]|nr:hypothetical protein [Candidatus Dormibacteraeota bacterium]
MGPARATTTFTAPGTTTAGWPRAEAQRDEKAPTCAGFLRRAKEFYARHGVLVQAVMTDNA